MNTPTPRTDAELYPMDGVDIVWPNFARILERELTALTKTQTCTHHNDQQRAACPVCLITALTAERDQLRAEAERLKANTHIAAIFARVERAEDECLEQARLLGMSGEREADLLGKLERAKMTERLWKEFITVLEIVEESDFGYKFNPNKISSCRALDGRKLNEILVKARKIVF